MRDRASLFSGLFQHLTRTLWPHVSLTSAFEILEEKYKFQLNKLTHLAFDVSVWSINGSLNFISTASSTTYVNPFAPNYIIRFPSSRREVRREALQPGTLISFLCSRLSNILKLIDLRLLLCWIEAKCWWDWRQMLSLINSDSCGNFIY